MKFREYLNIMKRFLRRFVPVSRTYTDKKFDDLNEAFMKQLKQQQEMLREQKKMLNELKRNDQLQKIILDEMSRNDQAQKSILDEMSRNDQTRKSILDELCHNDQEQKKILFELGKNDQAQKRMLEELRRNGQTQKKQSDELKQYVRQEFERRDEWPVRTVQNRRTAAGRSVWVIKCPAPDTAYKVRWGDYSFAMSLKRELEELGVYVVVDIREDWRCDEGADVVLVLRGCHFYRPDRRNENCLYILWNISHPADVSLDEYQLYDVVCVGSKHHAKVLQEKLTIPVIPLLQCTDTKLFYPATEELCDKEYIFVGNSRGVFRRSVLWSIENKLPLHVWGTGWDTMLQSQTDMIEAPFIENSELPQLYRTSKVTLNDHWDDMLEMQYVNNRIFDALACGLPVISDTCDELKEIFPDAVLHYETKEEFDECIRKIEEDYDSVKQKVKEQWGLIQREYSFEARAKELVRITDRFRRS